MTYEEALNYIHGLLKFGIKPGLDRVKMLCDNLGNPEDCLSFIHVAGTNGKGSVCAMLESIFRHNGMKTGLFISPYITNFTERLSINNIPISNNDFAHYISKMQPIIEKMINENNSPTEFEVLTSLAFLYFKENNTDIVVLETGLGGLLDSTNIIKSPKASVITSISMDHTDILGNTINEIALQKCGIIKKNGITISYPNQDINALSVIMEQCALKNNTLYMANLNSVKILESNIYGNKFIYRDIEVNLPLIGNHQILNAITAIETTFALNQHGYDISESAVTKGTKNVTFPARFEVFNKNPFIILDGAHNPDAIKKLYDNLAFLFEGKKITAICGILNDKDYEKSLSLIAPKINRFIAVSPNNNRALSSIKLADTAKKFCNNVKYFNNINEALQNALNNLHPDDVLIIFGSLYLAGEIRPLLIKKFILSTK